MNKKSDVLSHAKCPRDGSMWKLLAMLGIITHLDANIVGTYGPLSLKFSKWFIFQSAIQWIQFFLETHCTCIYES